MQLLITYKEITELVDYYWSQKTQFLASPLKFYYKGENCCGVKTKFFSLEPLSLSNPDIMNDNRISIAIKKGWLLKLLISTPITYKGIELKSGNIYVNLEDFLFYDKHPVKIDQIRFEEDGVLVLLKI